MTLAFWATAALLLAGALLFVLPPLLRPPARTQAGPSPLAAYREQRAQFDAELAQGTLSPSQHARSLEELQGRVLNEVGEQEDVSAAKPMARSTPLIATLAVALLVPAGALALYGLLGKPAALGPAQSQSAAGGSGAPHTMSREQMEQMVEALAARLKNSPNDAEGWHMLARSYLAFGRLPEAAQAYDRAAQLAPGDVQVLVDYADTLAMVNGRNLEGRPTELVNAALKIDPKHPKALALSGTAAFNSGDFAGAVKQWQQLQATLAPGSDQARSISASIAQAQAAANSPAQAKTGNAPAPQASLAAAAPGSGSIEGSVTIADALKPRMAGGATLFVFARAVSGQRIPLAIVRVPAGQQWPYRFKLDDSMAMTPQLKLSGQPEVMLGARISASGNATPQSGDLAGALGPVKVGARDVQLVIDSVVP
jgi:cytochrome c-type biogenesis protein CcmH